ncbi:hypothetical protein D3C78_1665620 [compost metagenome]
MIQRRVGQFQVPGLRLARLARTVLQVEAQPEHRARVAGIQHRPLVLAEAALQGRRADLGDARVAAHILEHVHHRTERQAPGVFVELDSAGQGRQQA